MSSIFLNLPHSRVYEITKRQHFSCLKCCKKKIKNKHSLKKKSQIFLY